MASIRPHLPFSGLIQEPCASRAQGFFSFNPGQHIKDKVLPTPEVGRQNRHGGAAHALCGGSPPSTDNTADIPTEMADILKVALDSLHKPFKDLLHWIQPDYFIHDFSQHWASTVAVELGIPAIYFYVFVAMTIGYLIVLSRNKSSETTVEDFLVPLLGYPSSAISLKRFEANTMLAAFNGAEDVRVIDQFFKSVEACEVMVIRSSFELESEYIHYLEVVLKNPVVSASLLLWEENPVSFEERNGCLRWLDDYPPSFVVYVSFESECFLLKEKVAELAEGLEESHFRFIWVLRSPHHGGSSEGARGLVPVGFEEQTREQGMVLWEWALQREILCHQSIGGFVSHCGWSSVFEALRFRVKIIALPIQIDQGLEARLVAEELQIGVEIGTGEEGSFKGEEISKCVREVVVGEEG